MREMKDSGIPWLGFIPADWKCGKVGYYSSITKLAGFEFTNYFDYEADGNVIAIRGVNLKNFNIDLSNIQTITEDVSDLLPRSQVKNNDILVSYAGSVGNIGLVENNEKRFHLAPNVGKITLNDSRVLPKFLAYYLVSYAGQEEIYQLKNKAISQQTVDK